MGAKHSPLVSDGCMLNGLLYEPKLLKGSMSSSAGYLGPAVKCQLGHRQVESQIFMTHHVSELQLVSADVYGCPVLYMGVLDSAVCSYFFSALFIASCVVPKRCVFKPIIR